MRIYLLQLNINNIIHLTRENGALNIHFSKTLKTMFRISHLNFGHSVEATYNEIG